MWTEDAIRKHNSVQCSTDHPDRVHLGAVVDVQQARRAGLEPRDAALGDQGEELQHETGNTQNSILETVSEDIYLLVVSEQYSRWLMRVPKDFLRRNMESLSRPTLRYEIWKKSINLLIPGLVVDTYIIFTRNMRQEKLVTANCAASTVGNVKSANIFMRTIMCRLRMVKNINFF